MYDRSGVLRAAGAETLLDENVNKAETEGWTKAEWQVSSSTHHYIDLTERNIYEQVQTAPPTPVHAC